MNKEQERTIGDYQVIRTLGSGTTCKVKLARSMSDNKEYAIKVIKKERFESNPYLEGKVNCEIAILRIIDHPNIIKLHDVLESKRHIFIVEEYAEEGELFDYINQHKQLSVIAAMDMFRQIIYALDYMQQSKICHRDLKLENNLLDSNMKIKIADFGFACWMKEGVATTCCGSPHYTAPEIIKGLIYDGRAVDI